VWTTYKTHETRLILDEMCYMMRTTGYTLLRMKRNEEITELIMSSLNNFFNTKRNFREMLKE
jgi:hypothetical protein